MSNNILNEDLERFKKLFNYDPTKGSTISEAKTRKEAPGYRDGGQLSEAEPEEEEEGFGAEETETESTPGPVSQDGTPTQEVKSNQKSEPTDITSLEDLILLQTSILNDIKRNTKATVSTIADVANS